MTRREIASRQITLYLPSKADLDRWRKLSDASALPLTKWVYEAVESFVENKPSGLKDTEELNALRLENVKLKQELEALIEKIHQDKINYADVYSQQPVLNKGVVYFLKTNGILYFNDLRENVHSTDHKATPWTKNIQSLRRTLFELEEADLVESTSEGYKWKG